jgi:4'-phosphopantetheinyl transferase
VPSSKIELIPDDYGKPFLRIENKEIPLYFNLSHTSGLISCVISKHRYTGIDVESIAGSHDNIVQQFFHAQEICDYRVLNKTCRIERFYTLWTLKEAYLKAIGHGLHIPLDSFRFLLSATDGVTSAAIHFDDQQDQEENKTFQFFLMQPTDRHQLAVAVRTQENKQVIEHQYSLTQGGSFVKIPMTSQ